MTKKVAIVGTAESWTKTPWDDPSMEVWGINDGYLSRDAHGRGMRRADRWFDLHPIDKFWYRKPGQKFLNAAEVPTGVYIRPDGHLEWLKEQARTIKVYLQDTPPADWPVNAQRFPIEQVTEAFGNYWASGPSYEVALAMLEGFEEIHVYGIHLATDAEYVHQRPNFEHLLGIARGKGINVVMADESPVLKHGWRYGYDPKPQAPVDPVRQAMKVELKQVQKEKHALIAALVNWPRFKSKGELPDRLRRLEVIEMDIQQQLAAGVRNGTVSAVVVAA